MPWALATVITLVAAVNWYSRRPGSDDNDYGPWIEWFTKPLVPVGLLAVADLIDVADSAQRQWFLIGLVLCLGGDVALMWRPEMFRIGLGSFVAGHGAFVAGFAARRELAPSWAVTVGAAVLVGCLVVGVRHLLPTVRRTAPELFGPVVVYVVVIATMAVASGWGGHWAAPFGAALFAVSDLTLADNKFVAERPWSPVVVMVTYHLALALMVLSLTELN